MLRQVQGRTVFEELDVCAHLGDLLDVHHDEALYLWVLLLVKPAICQRHDGECACVPSSVCGL
jgi:hypothetical protein